MSRKEQPPATVLRCRITPGAKRNELLGWVDEGAPNGRVLRVKIRAAPVEGRANRELIKFLAGELGVPKSKLSIRSGAKSRVKTVQVSVPVDLDL